MENNQFLERYRRESFILEHNRNATFMNPSVIPGNKVNLESHLLRIRGNTQGVYFDSGFKAQIPTLIILREKQKALAEKWEQHCQDQLKIGNAKPKHMPAAMQEESDKIMARIQVCNEEIAWLEAELQKVVDDQKKNHGSLLTHPRNWGSSQLRDGQLVEIGPWRVAPDETGLLRISDSSSPYDTMEAWRFKAEVLNPMSQEYILRCRNEVKAAEKEKRKRQVVPYPTPPTYDSVNDHVEYPADYGPSIIRKLKQNAE